MNRRGVLQLTAGATAGAGLVGMQSAEAKPLLPYIERQDKTVIFHKDWGSGKPVLFVHSAGVNSDIWNYQMVPMASAGMRCVAFDRRGHGRSSDPGRGYDYDTLADDLASVVNTLDLRGLTLVGHSMGCAEIVRYLTRHGSGRVKRIALLAPTLPFFMKTSDHPEGIDRSVFQSIRAKWMRDYPKWLADNSPPFFVPETSPQMIEWGTSLAYSTSLHAAVACNVSVTETDFRGELPRITVPTLILHGTADVSCPIGLTGRRAAALIPHSELKVYEGAPHGLLLTHIEQVNADLMRFIV